jgi:phosphoesterase RecJ-like protein
MIDHHGTGTPFADYCVLSEAAASGEIVLELILSSGVTLPRQMAVLLYAAISADTGCFRYSNTTKTTHLRAARLVEEGIDTAEINRQLYEAKSLSLLKAEKAGFERLHFYRDGRIAILTSPYALQQSLGLKDEHLGTLVDVARCVYGVEVAAAIRETSTPNTYRVSMRANVAFDVAAVAATFGGGGHTRAAGATLMANTAQEAEETLYRALLAAYSQKSEN